MTPHARYQLRANATRLRDDKKVDPKKKLEAQAIIKLIDESGLPLRATEGGGTSMTSPVSLRMEEIINSPDGRKAAFDAAAAGLPAMAYVDPLLQREMGADYNAQDQITNNAGYIVGVMMTKHGYRKGKEGVTLPAGCIAKSATMWMNPDSHR
jgi:hypothetical protein